MKRLFAEDIESYNAEGRAVDRATEAALRDIFQGWVNNGYSPRDVGSVMRWTINDLEVMTILDRKEK